MVADVRSCGLRAMRSKWLTTPAKPEAMQRDSVQAPALEDEVSMDRPQAGGSPRTKDGTSLFDTFELNQIIWKC